MLFWFLLTAAALTVVFGAIGLTYNRRPASGSGVVVPQGVRTLGTVLAVVLAGLLLGVALGVGAGALLGP